MSQMQQRLIEFSLRLASLTSGQARLSHRTLRSLLVSLLLFLSHNTGISPIESAVYGINKVHNLADIVQRPTSHPFVKSSQRVKEQSLLVLFKPKGLYMLTQF